MIGVLHKFKLLAFKFLGGPHDSKIGLDSGSFVAMKGDHQMNFSAFIFKIKSSFTVGSKLFPAHDG